MVCSTGRMLQLNLLDTQMQTGQGMLETGNQPSDIYTFWEVLLSVGKVASNPACVALSTTEAEYIALSSASQEAIWLQQLVSNLLNKRVQETTILEDNQSTICLAKNQQVHGRTKYVDIKYHFIRDLVEAEQIKLT